MFCSTLRRRRSFASIIPTLSAASGLGLRESALEDHHISLPLASNRAETGEESHDYVTTPVLRVLLFSTTDLAGIAVDDTLQGLRRFALSANGGRIVILLLLTPSTRSDRNNLGSVPMASGFTTAAQLLANDRAAVPPDGHTSYVAFQEMLRSAQTEAGIPYIPLLPLHALSALPQVLQMHKADVENATSISTAESFPCSPLDLLRQCSSHPPMRCTTAFYITDLFPDLRSYALACSQLCQGVGIGKGHAVSIARPNMQASLPFGLSRAQERGSSVSGEDDCDSRPRAMSDSRLEQLRILLDEREFDDIVSFWNMA